MGRVALKRVEVDRRLALRFRFVVPRRGRHADALGALGVLVRAVRSRDRALELLPSLHLHTAPAETTQRLLDQLRR